MVRLGFIGAGVVGTALATKLNEQGYVVTAVNSRTRASAERLAQSVNNCLVCDTKQAVADISDLVFITTPDAAISSVVSEIKWRPGQAVVHCSGADSTEVLLPARNMGAATGAFHPLQTFASVKQALENLPGTTFAIEAEGELKITLRALVESLKGEAIELKAEDKVIYHAAAVMASNYLVTLVKLADDLWQTFGIPREQATKALLPLIRGTLNNIDNVSIPQALTGPIARGDTGTVRKHLIALKTEAPDVLSTYCELGLQTIPIAQVKGKIDVDKAAELRALLKTTFKRGVNEDSEKSRNDALPVL